MKSLLLRLIALVLLSCVTRVQAQTPGSVVWSYTVGHPIQSSAVAGANDTVCVGTDDGFIYGLEGGGIVRWKFKTGGSIPGTPVSGPDNSLFVGATDRLVYGLNPDGTIKWLESPGSAVVASPALGADGTLYVATVFNAVYALAPDGAKKWEYVTGGNLSSSPAIGADGTIYLGSRDNFLYALNPWGTKKWTFPANDRITASPALGIDGTIYIGAFDGRLYAIDPDGTLKWTYAAGGPIRSSAAIGKDGTIYIGSDDNHLHAVSQEGKLKWTFKTDGWVRSSPAIAEDGTILFGSYDQKFYAVDASGKKKWEFETGGSISASPLLDKRGIAYFGSWDGRFYALHVGSPLAVTSWPLFRGDANRTGRALLALPANTSARQDGSKTNTPPLAVTPLDKIRPTVAITDPAVLTRIPYRRIAVSGTATDEVGIDRVEYQLNNGPVLRAKGTTNWTADVELNAGMNRIWAKSVDKSGNESVVISRNIIVVAGRILVRTTGNGRVTPEINDSEVKFGETYTFTAKPDKGQVFAGWTGGVKSMDPQLSVTLETNIVIQANFIPNPFVQASGSYHGLLQTREDGALQPEGYWKLDLKESGSWQATAYYRTNTRTFSGQFDTAGNSTVASGKDGRSLPRAQLHIDLVNESALLTGALFTDEALYDILADQEPAQKKDASPQAGRYTLEFSSRSSTNALQNGGHATLVVDNKGVGKLNGQLPNGTTFSHTAPVSAAGHWPLHARLGETGGTLVGWLRFSNRPESDVHGRLRWIDNGQATDAIASGSAFNTPSGQHPLLASSSIVITLDGGGLPEMIAALGEVKDGKEIELISGKNHKLSLSVSTATGEFTGKFQHPVTGQLTPFKGVLLQKQTNGVGAFTTPNGTGAVYILPGRQ